MAMAPSPPSQPPSLCIVSPSLSSPPHYSPSLCKAGSFVSRCVFRQHCWLQSHLWLFISLLPSIGLSITFFLGAVLVQNTFKSCCVWQFGCGGVEIVGVWRTGIEVVKILAQAQCMTRRWWGWLRSKWAGSGPRICKECSSRYQWNLAVIFQLMLLWLQKNIKISR